MALNLNTAMDALGTALLGITGLRAYDYLTDAVAPPCAIVGLPETITYDIAMKRGSDEAIFPVHVLVGKVSDRTARDKLATYCDGTAAATVSVKAALDGISSRVRVESVTFGTVDVGGIAYLSATFDVHYVA